MEFLIFWIGLSILAGVIASNKGRSGFGFFCLSLLLSPLIGIIAALAVQSNNDTIARRDIESGDSKKCPYCAELIRSEAVLCRYCGKEQPKPAPLVRVLTPPPDEEANAERYRREMQKIPPLAKSLVGLKWPWIQ